MDVIQVPVWTDNYAYLIPLSDGACALVDSPEAEPILELLEQRNLRLSHILNTHHHPDHIGANQRLLEAFPDLEVWAGSFDQEQHRIPGQTRALGHGERFQLGPLRGVVLEVPGHTLGHIVYRFDDDTVFVGDTLFVAGCGRLFEGDARMMDHSLNEVLAELPDEALLYCAHEYTEANLRFALSVEPDNSALQQYRDRVQARRAQQLPTVPSRMGDERAINPFLRCYSATIRASTGCGTEHPRHQVFGILRSMKDRFRG